MTGSRPGTTALALLLGLGLGLLLPGAPLGAAPARSDLRDLRHWSYEGYTRVVLELERAVETEVQRIPATGTRPERLFLDLEGVQVGDAFKAPVVVKDGLLHAVRIGQNAPGRARLVIDLDRYERHRLLLLRAPHRVVVDIYGESAGDGSSGTTRLPHDLRPVRTVVIDPGHGGRDPGAIGVRGLREKDVTLRLARILQPRLEKAGFRVVLTRDGDEALSLEERTAIAEGSGGDVFVSLHANAARRKGAQGIETYYLDANHERHTLRLAAIENGIAAAELDELQRTVASLRVSAVSEHSASLAATVQESLVGGLRKRYHRVEDLGAKRGPFYVLFLSTMPAVLVETGFLTHPDEARRLGSRKYLTLVADRLTDGLVRFRDRRAVLLAGGEP